VDQYEYAELGQGSDLRLLQMSAFLIDYPFADRLYPRALEVIERLIYIHKEQMLDSMQRYHPARHYVMVDDKLRILAAMKGVMQSRLTTVFPRQGHYALDPAMVAAYPAGDISIERIGDLLEADIHGLLAHEGKR
jgi:hypothetical protein